MLTLYSYPGLFGVADNNGYGLKVFAFLRLAGVPFTHEHIFDASAAPRGQLPYIDNDGETVGDSETIIAYVTRKYGVTIDATLTPAQRDTNLLVTRMIDDLYWVMSYSRWKDERFWPAFRAALLREHQSLTDAGLAKARDSTSSAIITRGSGAMNPKRPTRAGWPTCRCSRTSFLRTAMSTDRSRPALTPPSMASSPTFISTPSTHRSKSSCRPRQTS